MKTSTITTPCATIRRASSSQTAAATFDVYLRNRLMPYFGKLRLDSIDHARVSAWFDAASIRAPLRIGELPEDIV